MTLSVALAVSGWRTRWCLCGGQGGVCVEDKVVFGWRTKWCLGGGQGGVTLTRMLDTVWQDKQCAD